MDRNISTRDRIRVDEEMKSSESSLFTHILFSETPLRFFRYVPCITAACSQLLL